MFAFLYLVCVVVETKHRISGSGVKSKPQTKEPFIHVENNV
jgi:hypothetical protein